MIGTDAAISLIILSGAVLFVAGLIIGHDIGRNENAVLNCLRAWIEFPENANTKDPE